MKMKFDKFMELKESAVILSGKEAATLSEYKDHINKAADIKAEMKAFEEELAVVESINVSDILNKDASLFEAEELNEAEESKLKTSTSPIARMFRWRATIVAQKNMDKVYNKAFKELSQLVGNDVKVELKKDEVSKLSGPESKAKMVELNAMLERSKLQREKIELYKKEAIEKILSPGFFGAGSTFGFNQDVLDKYKALTNNQEQQNLAEFKLKAAQNVLTDTEMEKLKNSVKQLKARETKYATELKQTEDAVKDAMEKDDFSGADSDIKAEKEALDKKIDAVEVDMEDYRNKMADSTDDSKKEDYSKNLAALEKNKKGYQREMDALMKKAKKVVMGSTKKED